jgi:hypothetical protein
VTNPNTQTSPEKKPISEKQLIANRMNALLSTGPVSPEGKARASMNGLVHGMRSAKTVLPGESQDDYDARLQKWTVDLKAEGDVQRYTAARAVDASWKTERGEAVHAARAARRIYQVVEQANRRDKRRAQRLLKQLPHQPSLLDQLLATPAGVRLVRGEFVILAGRLVDGMPLLRTQRHRCLCLVGKNVESFYHDDWVATCWLRALIGATYGDQATPDQIITCLDGRRPEWMYQSEFDIRINEFKESLPSQAQATRLLEQYLVAEIDRLDALLVDVEAIAERNLALDVEAARLDSSIDEVRLSNQIQATDRSYHSALRQLRAVQNPTARRGPGRPLKTPKLTEGSATAGAPPAHDATAARTPGSCSSAGDTCRSATNLAQSLETTAASRTELRCVGANQPQDATAASGEAVAEPLGPCPPDSDPSHFAANLEESVVRALNDADLACLGSSRPQDSAAPRGEAVAQPLGYPPGGAPSQLAGILTSEPIWDAEGPTSPDRQLGLADCPVLGLGAFAERKATLDVECGGPPEEGAMGILTSEPFLADWKEPLELARPVRAAPPTEPICMPELTLNGWSSAELASSRDVAAPLPRDALARAD